MSTTSNDHDATRRHGGQDDHDTRSGYGHPATPRGWRHAHDAERTCVLCGTSYAAPYARRGPNYCGAACRAEALRLRRILRGQAGRYASIADRLGALVVEGSAMGRVLVNAAEVQARRKEAAADGASRFGLSGEPVRPPRPPQ